MCFASPGAVTGPFPAGAIGSMDHSHVIAGGQKLPGSQGLAAGLLLPASADRFSVAPASGVRAPAAPAAGGVGEVVAGGDVGAAGAVGIAGDVGAAGGAGLAGGED